jgi:hypothetical protein
MNLTNEIGHMLLIILLLKHFAIALAQTTISSPRNKARA